MGEKAIGIIVAVCIAGGVLWWKFGKQDDVSDAMYQEALALFETLPNYAGNEDEYAESLERVHDGVFDRHYMMGGRRTSARFDEDAYWTDLFATMATDLRDNGCRECGLDFVELFRRRTGQELDAGSP